jgi:hypothetical protein
MSKISQPSTAAVRHLVCVDELDIGFDDWGAAALTSKIPCNRYHWFNCE